MDSSLSTSIRDGPDTTIRYATPCVIDKPKIVYDADDVDDGVDMYDGTWAERCYESHNEEILYRGCKYDCTIKSHNHGYQTIDECQNTSSRKLGRRESLWVHLYEGCEEGCTHEAHDEFDKEDEDDYEEDQDYEYDGRELNAEERERYYWG
jgi:hypothetical protein